MSTAAMLRLRSNQKCVLRTPAQLSEPADLMPGISSSFRKKPKLCVRRVPAKGSQSAVIDGMAVTIFRKARPFVRSANIQSMAFSVRIRLPFSAPRLRNIRKNVI